MSRPLYDEDAHTYDTLFADPVEPWVDVVHAAAPPPGDLLHAHLRPGGVLVLDVRDLEATRERYAGGRTLRRDGFVSEGRMDGDLLRVVERVGGAVTEVVIRPWAPAEVERRLAAAGFATWQLGASPQRPDRLLAIARR